jgi:hypothetical protein
MREFSSSRAVPQIVKIVVSSNISNKNTFLKAFSSYWMVLTYNPDEYFTSFERIFASPEKARKNGGNEDIYYMTNLKKQIP